MSDNNVELTREQKYLKYRGKCKEMAEALVRKDPSLRLVRGYYHCPLWGKQAHWWAEKPDGTILDPTVEQFPSAGAGHYEEFDGMVECAECGRRIPESNAKLEGRYAFCDGTCYGRFIGLI